MLRRSISIMIILAGMLVVLGPATAMIIASFGGESIADQDRMLLNDPWLLTLRTLAWSLGVAIAAMLLGWIPGRILGATLHSTRRHGQGEEARSHGLSWVFLLAAILLPLLIPGYAIFYAWWQSWPSGSWLFDQLEAWDAIGLGRRMTLGLALVSWSWPIVSLCVAPAAATWPRSRSDQLATDGASRWQRLRALAHHDGGGLLLGGLLVAAFIFGNVICFDLAGVFTVGNEMRALLAVQASPGLMVAVTLPAALAAMIGAAITWWALGRPVEDASPVSGSVSRSAMLAIALTWCGTVLVPSVLIFASLDSSAFELWGAHGGSIIRDAIRAVILGVLVAMVYLGLLGVLRSGSSWSRFAGTVVSVPWVAMLLAPGSLVAAMVLSGISMIPSPSVQGWLLQGGVALFIGWLAKFGGIAALAARWVARSEPRPLQDLRLMHAGGWSAEGPRTWLIATGLGFVTGLLALGEIPISMRLSPPAPSPPVSVTLLNAMHYQRPETVIAVLALLLGIGVLVAIAIGLFSRMSWRRPRVTGSFMIMCSLVPLLLQGGCTESGTGTTPLEVELVIGGPGRSTGRFDYPRAMAVDPGSGDYFVIEKSGRVQRLDPTGQPVTSWVMPRIDRGRPTGISIGPAGNVWIADTHEHRVMVYDPSGKLLTQLGSYGHGQGEFIYPTDIAFGPEGLVYVSEYGGNDRIQVFTPEGHWVRTLGGPGDQPGRFDRPQSIAFSREGDSLFVADTRNRRIQEIDVVTGSGRVVYQGGPTAPLGVPFGLWPCSDGTFLVTDTGAHQLCRLDDRGEITVLGGGWGWGDGQLRDPWAVAGYGGDTLILDSGNNRILRVPGQGS